MSEIHTEIFRDEIRYLGFASQYLRRDKEWKLGWRKTSCELIIVGVIDIFIKLFFLFWHLKFSIITIFNSFYIHRRGEIGVKVTIYIIKGLWLWSYHQTSSGSDGRWGGARRVRYKLLLAESYWGGELPAVEGWAASWGEQKWATRADFMRAGPLVHNNKSIIC